MKRFSVFRIRSKGLILTLRVLSDNDAEVIDPGTTSFLVGDIVAPARPIFWDKARERMGSTRTRLSPNSLVLVAAAVEGSSSARVHDFAHFVASKRDPKPVA